MNNFAFAFASRPEEAATAASQPGAMMVAGGTELLNWMRLGIAAPERIVDIGRMRRHGQIRQDGERLIIGARHVERGRRASARARTCGGARRGVPERGLGAGAPPRHLGRQRAAEDALCVLPLRSAAAVGLQQAAAGVGLRGARGPERSPRDLRLDRRLRRHAAVGPGGRAGVPRCQRRGDRPQGASHCR